MSFFRFRTHWVVTSARLSSDVTTQITFTYIIRPLLHNFPPHSMLPFHPPTKFLFFFAKKCISDCCVFYSKRLLKYGNRLPNSRTCKNAFLTSPNVPNLIPKVRDFILTNNGCFYKENEVML